ncbi:polysialyltransferase family glycosyltransferase [Klebsiella sp. B345]|uniref:polysialyltransferase family glycosyltransferase n=1 Tax=Klebsiella sp. B345 TaxID=2755398 RepID=UPI003DA87245
MKKNYTQILSVIENIRVDKILEVDVEAGKKNIFKIKALFDSYLPCTVEPYSLICGEYRSMIFWYICGRFSCRKVIMLDDGTATLRINRKNRVFKRTFRDYIYKLFGFVDGFMEPVVFFSVYDISLLISSRDTLITHKYDCFKKKMESFPVGDNVVYVIGSPFMEAGVVNDDDIPPTLEMISRLKYKYKKVIYISHRRERKEKLVKISEYVSVENLDYPFELLPLALGRKISSIAGFYSSLFDNMYVICGGALTIECFYLPKNTINPSWHSFVSDVYDNYHRYPDGSFIFHHLD